MVVVMNKLFDRVFQLAWIVIMLQLYDVLHGTMIAFNLAIGLRMIGRGQDVADAALLEILPKVGRDERRAPIRDQPRPALTSHPLQARELHGLLHDLAERTGVHRRLQSPS